MLLAALPLVAVGGCNRGDDEANDAPTFHRDVAPLLAAHCVDCHRPGGSAPFALVTARDVRDRAKTVLDVVRSGYMPPWLPSDDGVPLLGKRGLSDTERDVLARWVDAGAPKGEGDDGSDGAPSPLPVETSAWSRGEPDLVVTAPDAFDVPARGDDIFRNLVLPTGLAATRFVRAVEIAPGNPRVVHHGILAVDGSGDALRRDRAAPGPGFPGMDIGRATAPDGHFLGWTPGKRPTESPPGMAWRLRLGQVFVLQLHIVPSGRAERIRPRIGLWFTDEAPRRSPFSAILFREDIDIPAGAKDHAVRDRYEVPVDAVALSCYPHAHYLARRMRVTATRPGDAPFTLLDIPAWDFDWQDDYRFASPVALPAGTVVEMTYHYDNSADNPRNPHSPPQRVRFGPQSSDEMATFTLQLLPDRPEDRARLELHAWRRHVERRPRDAGSWRGLGDALVTAEAFAEAEKAFRRALEIEPRLAPAQVGVARARHGLGDAAGARRALERALAIDPASPDALNDLAVSRLGTPRAREAIALLRRAVRSNPFHAEALGNLGVRLAIAGDAAAARDLFRRALAVAPERPETHNNLANAFFQEGRHDEAARHYRGALAIRPRYFNAQFNLARVLDAMGRVEESRLAYRRAAKLRPGDRRTAEALRRLGSSGEGR